MTTGTEVPSQPIEKISSKVVEQNKHDRVSLVNDINEYTDNESDQSASAVEEKPIPRPKPALVQDSSALVKRSKSHQKVRYNRDGSLRSKFADAIFKPQESIFDENIKYGASFYGFYVAAWFSTGLMLFNLMIHYYLDHGNLLKSKLVILLSENIVDVALFDLSMYLSLYPSFLIHYAVKSKLINWKSTGFVLQTLLEVAFLVGTLYFNLTLDFTWITRIFIFLHSLVLLMKLHSYGFSNGYLWDIQDELKYSTNYLSKYKDSLSSDITEILVKSISFCEFELNCSSIEELDDDNNNGKDKSQTNATTQFPDNITIKNFFEYTMFPTLIYELNYPRTKSIRWSYLFTKITGIFGVIFLMIIVAESFLFPIVDKCLALRSTETLFKRLQLYPLILLDTIPPFLLIYILVFYLIWELILNAIGELSYFGDRNFYRYWWNDVNWYEYSKDWNIPVHFFLLRHVYHSSISSLQLSKTQATLFTFVLSSVFHELSMFIIFKRLRIYLLLLQMLQLPLISISNSAILKDQKIIGNAIFWFGIIFGPSLMLTSYLLF